MRTEELLWNTYFENETIDYQETSSSLELEKELQELYEMTQEEACKLYEVDNKAEAEILIREYWN